MPGISVILENRRSYRDRRGETVKGEDQEHRTKTNIGSGESRKKICQSTLVYGQNQHNIVKQISSNNRNRKRHQQGNGRILRNDESEIIEKRKELKKLSRRMKIYRGES